MRIERIAFSAQHLTTDSKARIWAIATDGKAVRQHEDDSFRRLPGSPSDLDQITVDIRGVPWVLHQNGTVHRLQDGRWERMHGVFTAIRASVNEDEVWGVVPDHTLRIFSNQDKTSRPVHPRLKNVRAIAPTRVGMLRLDRDGRVHTLRGQKWVRLRLDDKTLGADVWVSPRAPERFCIDQKGTLLVLHNRRSWVPASLDADDVKHAAWMPHGVVVLHRDGRIVRYSTGMQFRGRGMSDELHETLHRISRTGGSVRHLVCPSRRGFVLIDSRNRLRIEGRVLRTFADAIRRHREAGESIQVLATTPGGERWLVVTDQGLSSDRLTRSSDLMKRILAAQKAGETVLSVAFTSLQRFILVTDKGVQDIGLSPFLRQAIENFERMSGRDFMRTAALGKFGAVLLSRRVQDESFVSNNNLFSALVGIRKKGFRTQWVVSIGNSGWVAMAKGHVHASEIAHHPHGFERKARSGHIRRSMERSGIPGMAVGIVDRNHVQWIGCYGRNQAEIGAPVRPDSLFQTASISKVLTALGIFRLIEQKRFTLETDVTTLLRGWRPETVSDVDLGQTPLLIRHLLSHSGCTSVHGFTSVEDLDDIPTVLEILRGDSPAKNDPVEVVGTPGTGADYSGGGYQILEKIIEDVTGQSFSVWMRDEVLRPLGMHKSTFDKFRKGASMSPAFGLAIGHEDGEPVKRHPPALAAGGLYSSAEELAKVLVMINLKGITAEGKKFLDVASVDALLTNQHQSQRLKGNPGWGLGIDVSSDRPPTAHSFRYAHGGSQIGYFSLMAGFPNRRTGAVVLLNGDKEGFREAVIDLIEAVYG